MTDQYHVVVVGGGHNGLVTASYLAKSGKKVLVLEARDKVPKHDECAHQASRSGRAVALEVVSWISRVYG